MNIPGLLKGIPHQSSRPIGDEAVTGVSYHSDHVQKGHVFCVVKSLHGQDVTPHIIKAQEKGAVCIIKDQDTPVPQELGEKMLIVDVLNARWARAKMASNLYPSQTPCQVAVTGTNGKTTVAHLLYQLWKAMGYQATYMGTLGLETTLASPHFKGHTLTSPDPLILHRTLFSLRQQGGTHTVIEASSQGLHQHRLDCLDLNAAGFTNLSHEHLDYHGDINAYFDAKVHLFRHILPEGSPVVLNGDDFRFQALKAICQEKGHRIITFGRGTYDISLDSVELDETGQTLSLKIFGRHHQVHLPLVGVIQSYNVMTALGLALATGSKEAAVLEALTCLTSVPGRFEWVGTLKNKARIYVDYAHTPRALEALLTSMRPHVQGALSVVFGCGGNRDSSKREAMAKTAFDHADRVIITDDNPRHEDPESIRKTLLQACPTAMEIADRREAIATALAKCGPGDVCIIAGKGHETGQIVGDTVLPFSDRDVAQKEIGLLSGTLSPGIQTS